MGVVRLLPPILEIFIVWHPDDAVGPRLADAIFAHFTQGHTFSGVIGGGIQVSLRSAGWESAGSAPRPIYVEGSPAPNGIPPANFVAVVPLLGTEMAKKTQVVDSSWHRFISTIEGMESKAQKRFGVFPYLLSDNAMNGTELSRILGKYQRIKGDGQNQNGEDFSTLCRDLTQGIAQLISPGRKNRLTAFISHTKQHDYNEGEDTNSLIGLIIEMIGKSRLDKFFDASDLQPGTDWDAELRKKSRTSAMLAIRTDLYSSREWCQREVVIAKTHGMPVIVMDAIDHGEKRGSFLMDHVPRIAVRKSPEGYWRRQDVHRALNLLVDECLKRALWIRQKELAQGRFGFDIDWWAPHAPEPLTLSHWIDNCVRQKLKGKKNFRILHPDPPLGPEEQRVLLNYARNTRLGREIDIMTPSQLAMRSG